MKTKTFECWIGYNKWGTVIASGKWYAIQGSNELFAAAFPSELYEGTNINSVIDSDESLTASPIMNEQDLLMAIMSR